VYNRPWKVNVHGSVSILSPLQINHSSAHSRRPWYTPFRLLYISLISFAAKNCLTAHASTSSGATIIQNINFKRFHRACHFLRGGTLGCTAVHAHSIVVDKQLQTIPNKVRFNGLLQDSTHSVSSRATKLNIAGVTLQAERMESRK